MNGADKEMTVLGIDTSSAFASAALMKNGTLAASFTLNAGHTHSETILPMIKNVLGAAAVPVDEISLVACTTGPGSFTGVRIGVSSAKGLCEPRRIPCVGVSALEAASYTAAGTDGICVPVTDARRGNVYAAAFDVRGEKPVRLFEDTIIPIGELCALLGQYGQTVYFVGDAAETLSRAARECGLRSPALSPCMRISQTAAGACFAALDAWQGASDKEKFEAKYLSPVYLRDGRMSNPGGEK